MTQPFWKMKTLSQLSKPEWESLCDGCGKCCLIQLEDEDSGMRLHTDVTCRLFNADTCRCGDYTNRKIRVPDCVILDPVNVTQLDWMPRTCAYRLIAEGKDLYDWHPLVSGDPMSVHNAGMSIRNQVVSEDDVTEAEWEDRIVEWPGEGDDDELEDGDLEDEA